MPLHCHWLHGWAMRPLCWHAMRALLPASWQHHDHHPMQPRWTLPAPPSSSIWLGWSLGALVLLQRLVCRADFRPRACILMAGSPGFVQRPDWPHGLPRQVWSQFGQDLHQQPERGLRRFQQLCSRGDARASHIRQQLPAIMTPTPNTASLLAGLDRMRHLYVADLLHHIRVPVLLLHGMNDAIAPLPAARATAQRLPNAQLVTLSQCGHAPLLSQPDACAAAIQAFVSKTR